MKKGLLLIIVICLSLGLMVGCNKKNKADEDKYKVEIFEDNTEASGIAMNVKRARVTNSIRAEEAKKITTYLNDVLDEDIADFQDSVTSYDAEEEVEGEYEFDYKYSLLNETDSFLIFKLTTLWQAGGPYPSDSTEYYMFDKETGEIVYFDDLFTSEEVNKKVYDYIINYLEKVYKENGNTFNEVESGISESILEPGKFVYNNNKLIISLPKGLYTVVAYGSIDIEVPSSVYSNYLK